MKTTNQIKHLRPRSTDGFFPYRNTKWFSEEEIKERISIEIDGKRLLDVDKAVKFFEELFGDKE